MSEKMPREQIALLKNVIEDLQERVQTASESIGAIAQALDEQHDEAAQPDFERLRYESEKQAYAGHPAARSAMPEMYFLLLVSVLTAADATQAQWRHLYRTAAGAGYEADVRDLLPDAYSLTDAKLIEAVDSIKRDELTNAFILDCILLALLHEGDAAALLAYIADLFALLGAEKEVVSETMQAAKIIVAQDREAYLAMMVDMEHIYSHDNYFYLFHLDAKTFISDLSQAPFIDADHLTVFCAKAKNMELNLDSWQAEEITFQGCRFENSKITSSEREFHFTDCTFYESNDNTGNTEIDLRKRGTFAKCTFKNITREGRTPLYLSHTEITECTFSDCSIHDCNFLNLHNGTITDSEFIRCNGDVEYPIIYMEQTNILRCKISECSHHTGTILYLEGGEIKDSEFSHCNSDDKYALFSVSETNVIHCNFLYCKTNCNGADWASILKIKNDSKVRDCHFKQCIAKNIYDCSTFMIDVTDSTQTNNTFHDCSCDHYVG